MGKKIRYEDIRYRRELNRLKPCEHPKCHNPRRGVSRYCTHHENKQQRFGHPDGRHVPPRFYACEAEEAKKFIDKHLDHKGIQAAISWFDDWISESTLGKAVPGGTSLRRLNDHGVTGRRCLEAVVSLWLYAYRRPGAIPHDVRLDFALALVLLRLAPEEKKITWKDGEARQYGKHIGYRIRKEVGVYIRQTLYVLVKNMVDTINKEEEMENQLKLDMAKGFD